ncbi:hypothetical protein ACRAVF_27005 [Bradyrhizobium oligotrophicum S58]
MNAPAYVNDTQSAVITVERIIPAPGPQRSATIKDSEGLSYGIWPNRLAQVQPGLIYDITFSSTIKNGVVFRDIKDIRFRSGPAPAQTQTHTQTHTSAQTARPAAPAAAPGAGQGGSTPGGYYRPTSPRDAERMFVCSMMNALIETGKVETNVHAMIGSVNALRQVWQATFGADDQ